MITAEGVVLGVVIGASCGAFLMALLTIGKVSDASAEAYRAGERAERERKRREDLGIIDLNELGVGSDRRWTA